MKKAIIAVVIVVIGFFGIKLLFNNGPVVDPKAEVKAYLTRQLDGLKCDLSDLELKVQETDEENVKVVLVSGSIECKGTLVVKETEAGFTVAPVVTEAVVKDEPEQCDETEKAASTEPASDAAKKTSAPEKAEPAAP